MRRGFSAPCPSAGDGDKNRFYGGFRDQSVDGFRLHKERKFRNTEHPNTLDPSSGTPGRKSGAVLLDLLLAVIGKNARGQGADITPARPSY